MTRSEIERHRRRIVVALSAALGACAVFGLIFSFMGPDLAQHLTEAPWGIRIGLALVIVGLIALVLERNAALRRAQDLSDRYEVLIAGIESRVESMEFEGVERAATLGFVDEVLGSVLQAAIDLTGAVDGTIEIFDEPKPRSIDLSDPPLESTRRFDLPAPDEGVLGEVVLSFATSARPPDEDRLQAAAILLARSSELIARLRRRSRDNESTELRVTDAAKSRFLALVSHELRTPLTSVIGFTSTLENHWEKLSEEQKREFVRSTQREGYKLARLIERILEAAEVEIDGVELMPVSHDVRMSLWEGLRPFMETDRERLRPEIPQLPLVAEIDPFVAHQVVQNLVDNGLRYTTGTVAVRLEGFGSGVRIIVGDEGPGMTPQKLAAVKTEDYRVDQDVTSGSGFGLHVVRRLIHDHGGILELSSDESGTVARATLRSGAGKPARVMHGTSLRRRARSAQTSQTTT